MKKAKLRLILSMCCTASFSTTTAAQENSCLPITMPANNVIFASPKKVFAHYFSRFPLSLDNKRWQNDYYSVNYLNEHGEHDKWLAHGGYLRARPLPTSPSSPADYKITNLEKEIRFALSWYQRLYV